MSRIGKNPIVIPDVVSVVHTKEKIEVSGPKGKLDLDLRPEIIVEVKDNTLIVAKNKAIKKSEAMQGLYRVLINNMVTGVTNGFSKKLELIGTGYKANVDGKKIIMNLGYSYPYELEMPEGITIKVEDNNVINIEGINKQLVGQVAANLRKMRPPEPYKGKGVKYVDEVIRRKAGKATK